jgi:PKD domain
MLIFPVIFGYGFPVAGRNTSPYSHVLPFPTQGGKKIRHNGKSIWKMTIFIFTLVMIMTLLSTGASAKCVCTKTPLGDGTPPATQCLSCGCGHIDYTAVAASKSDPRCVQFKDLSGGKETYIGWEFGDGTHLGGTKITSSLQNPVHKYKKTGYYITELTIRCGKCGKLLWVHYNVVIK